MVFGAIILQSLFYFLPGYAANGPPIYFAKYKIWEFLNVPIDGNRKFRGEPLFGHTKTWRGVIAGTLIAVLVSFLQIYLIMRFDSLRWLNFGDFSIKKYILIAFFQGLGVGLGDLVKSFFKRRLHIASSKPWVPFDQMDYLGGLILSLVIYIPDLNHLLVVLLISPFLPIIANWFAYKVGWKKVWW